MVQNWKQIGPQRYRETFGRHYEDFQVGDVYEHRPGKTVLESDNHLFTLLTLNTHTWSVWVATAAVSLASMCHLGAIISYGVTVTSGVPDEEQGLATGLVTSTQQVGITIGIPLLGVLATTSGDLMSGVHTVVGIDAAIALGAAVLVAVGLRSRRAGSGTVEAEPFGAR